MLALFGQRQQDLLKQLLRQPAGLSKDELASALAITRTAVGQHLAALEAAGFVRKGPERRTAGRPGRAWVLTEAGRELFPRQYTWFSGLMLEAIKAERGPAGLEAWLRDLAGTVAASLAPRVAGLEGPARVAAVVAIMNELAFEARAADGEAIEASNCVYHGLAQAHPEVCAFDRALLARLLGAEPAHPVCMARGDGLCRFEPGRGCSAGQVEPQAL